jgi:hypothetical protein
VHDALLGVVHRVERHAELGAVLAQRLDLGARHRVGDGQLDVGGRDVVVLGGQRQVGAPDRAAGQPQPVERLRAGDLVHQVQVDVEQVGFVALTGAHQVPVPDLLGQRASHVIAPVTTRGGFS